jgi:hypothetical protein
MSFAAVVGYATQEVVAVARMTVVVPLDAVGLIPVSSVLSWSVPGICAEDTPTI